MARKQRKPSWIDKAEHLEKNLTARAEAARSILAEARTYTQAYYDVPAQVSDDPTAKVLDSLGMRELGWNLIAEQVRSICAQIVKPLTAKVVPVGGTWEQHRSCIALGQVIDGCLDQVEFTKLAGALVVDGMLVPTGGHVLWECHPKTKDIAPERLEPTRVFFSLDRTDVLFERFMPRRQARAKYAGKDEALLEFFDYEVECAKPEHITGVDASGQFEAEDLISVKEGYALAAGDEPARHVVVIGKKVLVDEELKADKLPTLPIASFVWSPGHRGESDGKPMARSIAGQHSWLQEMIWKLYDSLAGAVPWVENAPEDWEPSDVPHQKVPNGENGNPVKITFPPGVSQDVRTHIADLLASASRATGNSEQSTESAVPASLTTGLAIANWKSVINEGLSPQHRNYDALWSTSGKIIHALGQANWTGHKARSKANGTEVINQVDWNTIKLPEEGFRLYFDVVSGLGQRIPQKVQLLELAYEKGVIDVGGYFTHLDLTDFKAAAKRLNGPRNYIEYQISQALDHGKVVAPTEFQDAMLLAKESGNAWQAARSSVAPPPRENLEACRILFRLAKARSKALPPPVPGAGPATGPSPAAAAIAAPLATPSQTPPIPPTTNGPALPVA